MNKMENYHPLNRENSDSAAECLTRDRGAAGSHIIVNFILEGFLGFMKNRIV